MSVVTFVLDDTNMGQKLSKRCIILGVKLSPRSIVSRSGGGVGIELHMYETNQLQSCMARGAYVRFDGPIWLEHSQRDRSPCGVVVA